MHNKNLNVKLKLRKMCFKTRLICLKLKLNCIVQPSMHEIVIRRSLEEAYIKGHIR